jgi:hypothetical protein
VLVRVDHVARFIVNPDGGVMRTTVKLCVSDCIADCVWFPVPQPIKWQHITDWIDAAIVPARSNLVRVLFLCHLEIGARFRTLHFLGCEAFSLTSQKDVNGHQKGQAQFVGGYLSLLEPR